MQTKPLLDYWLILYKRKLEIIAVTLIAFFTAIIISVKLEPIYEAKTQFYLSSSSPAISYFSEQTIHNMAKDFSPPLLLKDEYAPYIGLLKSETFAALVHAEYPRKAIPKLLLSDMDFEVTNENLIKLYSRDKDPDLAAEVANAYVRHLNRFLQNSSLENIEQDIKLLQAKLIDTRQKIMAAETALKTFEEHHTVASIERETSNLTDLKTSFVSQLESNRIQVKENSGKINALSVQLQKEDVILAKENFTVRTPLIEYLQKKLSDFSSQISAKSVELEENHPDMVILKEQYTKTSARLEEEIRKIVNAQIKPVDTFYEQLRQNLVNLMIEKNRLEAAVQGVASAINRINEKLKELPAIKTEYITLLETLNRHKKIYEQLQLDLHEIEMQRERQIQFVVIVDSATPPRSPAFPIVWLNALVALICGFTGGIVYAFFIESIAQSRAIRTRKLIKALLAEK